MTPRAHRGAWISPPQQLAAFVRRYGDASDPQQLATLAAELRRDWPGDREAQRVVRLIDRKARRLAKAN